jgi:CubicO group peptidase (beta-lactamase class C family)
MNKNSVTGLSIALVDDQHIVWSGGFGYADQEQKIPATAETLYRVGSISKLFTDTAAMQLVEQGQLDIDQPLRKYLPGFSIKTNYTDTADITPRMLMTHHSGLPRDRLKGFMTLQPSPFTELIEDIRNEYVAYPPNHIFSYSNLGISLLGLAIQNQSGILFADYMQQSVLAPLGMTNSSFDVGVSTSALMAKGYQGTKPELDPPLRDVPAGGLNSSVTDMSHFMSMVFAGGISGDHRLLKAETINEMLRPQNMNVPLDFNFRVGLGWMLSTLGGSTIENAGIVAHHSGGTILFHSQMYLLPEHKLGVIVLSNSSAAGKVVDHIATETLSLALQAKTGIHQPEHNKIMTDDKPLSVETVQDYVGDYTTLAGFAQIKACGKGICANVANHNFDLIRGSDGQFRLDYSLLGIFHINLGNLGEIGLTRRTMNGRDLLVARVGSQEMLVGQRIQAISNPYTWRKYLGDYEITNLEDDYNFNDHISLTEERGFLLIEMTPKNSNGGKRRIPLMPITDSEGLLLGPLSDGGETIRIVKENGEERVLFSGYMLKKIAP